MSECKISFLLILPVTVATTLIAYQLVSSLVCTSVKRLLLIEPLHVRLDHSSVFKYSQAESGTTVLSSYLGSTT